MERNKVKMMVLHSFIHQDFHCLIGHFMKVSKLVMNRTWLCSVKILQRRIQSSDEKCY